ncbi:MAG TPA: FHA domain-containing protein [Chthoniobacteraceae bacterium]|jgi:hypothetical protein|nr:FHA domain-containing protein [Chthoniobacteraceae bacterium]
MCFLVGSLPNGLVFRHELANHRSTIGRMGISTILLEEESVSALHAELIRVGDRKYLLRDLRSRNGTSVDGEKVSEAEIKAPCRLGFGHLSCELQLCESESCMAHGKTHSPAHDPGLIRRPLPPPAVPAQPTTPHDQSSRHRKSRPLSRKRRGKHAGAKKIDLSEAPASAPAAPAAGRRDTVPESFPAPCRHAGDRAFHFSPKILALGTCVLAFCALAISYSGPRHAPRKLARATPAPHASAVLAKVVSPAPVAPEPEKGGDSLSLAVIEPPKNPPNESSIAAGATAPIEPAAPLAALPKVENPPEPIAGSPEEETDPDAKGAVPALTPPVVESTAPIEASPTVEASAIAAPTPVPEIAANSEVSPKGEIPAPTASGADPEAEETLVLQEAKLLASVSKPERPFASLPVAPLPNEDEAADARDTERAAPLDFSMPMGFERPPRPWEASPARETDLALNDYTRLVAPWSFEAGVARIGGGDMASLFRRPPTVKIPVPAPVKPVVQEPMSVMILGDSLALCGFGSRLDKRFRESTNVRSTNTYMACGTVPMSWMKEPPYGSLKTYCGFWTIEDPVAAGKKPASFQDTYGMGKGKPKAYPVPKLEDLFAKASPEVLILQTGTNLFSLFRDGKTVQPEHHVPMLRSQIQPFLAKILKLPQPPRAIYWVASPTSGRVSPEVQDFVIQQITALVGPMAKVIDSRQLVSFPYRHMEPDKEHFIGQDMDQWADRVYDIVQRDLAAHPLPLALARPPGLPAEQIAVAKPVGKPNVNDPTAVHLTARLVSKTKPMPIEQLKPYNEAIVGFVYEVQKVTEGEYPHPKIVVMHPAYIGNVSQPLDKLRIGKTYELNVHELQESSPWSTAKPKDDSGLIDLLPYIQLADEARFPGHQP